MIPIIQTRVGSEKQKKLAPIIRDRDVGPQDTPEVIRCTCKLKRGKKINLCEGYLEVCAPF